MDTTKATHQPAADLAATKRDLTLTSVHLANHALGREEELRQLH